MRKEPVLEATYEAPPNIALVKYWGVRDRARAIPYNSSISVTLDRLRSRTTVRFDPGLSTDRVELNGALATEESNATNLKQSLNSANGELQTTKATLASTQNQLAAVQGQLSSTQSSLNSYSSLYLPIGVAIPVVIAIIFAILYLRKHPKPVAPTTP